MSWSVLHIYIIARLLREGGAQTRSLHELSNANTTEYSYVLTP
jgi:hypothetical protein